MALQFPIIGYALAEGTGKLAMSPEGMKNARNLASVFAAMSWIDEHASDLISVSGVEHAELTTPFEYFGGSRVTFEPASYAKYKLEQILEHYAEKKKKIAILIPSREALCKVYDDDVMRKIWDRKSHGFDVQVLSIDCPEFPLRQSVGYIGIEIADYLLQNAMRTEIFIQNSVKGSIGQPKRRFGRGRSAWG